MFNKLKQLLSGKTESPPPTDDDEFLDNLPPELLNNIDVTIPRTAYFDRDIADDQPCPACKSILEITYAPAPFMVALTDQRGHTIDGFAMGDPKIGRFCPTCPTIIIDMTAVENKLDAFAENLDDLPDNYGIAVMGLLDLETMEELEQQGVELEEYPIIPFLSPKNTTQKRPNGRKKQKPRKKQKKRR